MQPANLLRFDTFQRDVQVYSLGSRARAFDAEVIQVQRSLGVEASTFAAPRILAFTVERGLEGHRLGDTVEGQVAGHVSRLFAGWCNCGRNELGIGELANVQEVLAGDVLVTFSVVGPQAGGFHVDGDFAGFRLGGIPAERTIPVLEGTVDVAVAQVADFPVDEGVLAFLVDLVISSHHLTGRQQSSTDCQSGESLFQHAFYSM